jgi:hypothetical protein
LYALLMMGGSTTPKHVEQFPDINKLCNVASCWIYIGKLLAYPILYISRIRVKRAYIILRETVVIYNCTLVVITPIKDARYLH